MPSIQALLLLWIVMLSFFSSRALRRTVAHRGFQLNSSHRDIPPLMHYSSIPDETIYLLDATSMLFTAHYSREVAAEYADLTTYFPHSPEERLPCGALVGFAMHFSRLIRDLKPRYVVAAFDIGKIVHIYILL